MVDNICDDIREFLVEEDEDGDRLDVYLADQFVDMSRSYIQKIIKDKKVTVNGKVEKAKYLVKEEDKIVIEIPKPKVLEVVPQDIPIEIVYEDDDIIIVNKPQGMVVHPAPGNYEGTLVNAILYHCKGNLSSINGVIRPDDDIIIVNKPQGMVVHPAPGNYEGTLVNAILYHCKGNLSSINGVIRPGIVHRIDKDTSGILMIAKNNNAHNCLAEQLKDHSITREYEFICHGVFKEDNVTVDRPIGRNPKDRLKMAIVPNGKRAVTHFEVIERFNGYTHVRARLETGRTHQIRVHAMSINHPLVGDPVYGPKTHFEVIERFNGYTHVRARLETGRTHQIRVHAMSINHPLVGDPVYGPKNSKIKLNGQALHAKKLGFIHPTTKEYVEFDSELPDYFQKLLEKLRK